MSNNPYRPQRNHDRQEWPPRATAPDARDIHLGRIASALEGILEELVGINSEYTARIPPAPEEHHHPSQAHFMHDDEGRGNGV